MPHVTYLIDCTPPPTDRMYRLNSNWQNMHMIDVPSMRCNIWESFEHDNDLVYEGMIGHAYEYPLFIAEDKSPSLNRIYDHISDCVRHSPTGLLVLVAYGYDNDSEILRSDLAAEIEASRREGSHHIYVGIDQDAATEARAVGIQHAISIKSKEPFDGFQMLLACLRQYAMQGNLPDEVEGCLVAVK